MTTATIETFRELLRTSNLLATAEFDEIWRKTVGDEPVPPDEAAERLVACGILTRWQAQLLLSGKNRFFLGKYKLLECVGTGGMGTVLKARQGGLGRIVALKVMSEALVGNEQAAARFHREIRSAAALEHPNIVATFDADCVEGTHFLVMEYVEGESLELLAKRRGRLPIGEACEYIRQAALGLAHAHERGMVHRDIKPANLLLAMPSLSRGSPEGVAPGANDALPTEDFQFPMVKILDFGLARLTAETTNESELTQTGQIMGTPDYISPEQARNTRVADIRSDIYSLGCTLFRLLTGQVPFGGQSVMEKLMARALEEAPRAKSLIPDLPTQLDACIARMLARDPARRFQTPAEVAASLAAIGLAFAPGAVPLSLAPAEPAALEAGTPLDPGLDRFLAVLATEAKGDSAASAIDTASASVPDGVGGATYVDAPRAGLTAMPRQPRRKWTTSERLISRGRRRSSVAAAVLGVLLVAAVGLVVWYRAGATSIEITWPDDERKGVTLTVDGRERVPAGNLIFTGRAGKRTLKFARKGYEPIEEEWNLARGETVQYRPEWKPTAQTARRRELAVLKREIEKIKLQSAGELPLSDDPAVVALRTKFDDFARRRPGTPEAIQAAGLLRRLPGPFDRLSRDSIPENELRFSGPGEQRTAPPELVAFVGDSRLRHSGPVYSVAYSPDDSVVAAGDGSGFVKIWNAADGSEIATIEAHANAVMGIAWSPDGKVFLTGGMDGFARFWDSSTFKQRRVLKRHSEQIRCVAWSPVGDLVATGGVDNTIKFWNPADGSEIRTITVDSEPGFAASLSFSPDGQTLGVGCNEPFKAHLFNVADGARRHLLEGHEHSVLTVAFSPDGKTLATSGYDRMLRFWNVDNGALDKKICLETNTTPYSIAFSADGQTIAAGITDGSIRQWNAETLAREKTIETGTQSILTIAFSHRGRHLASAGNAQSVALWDATAGDQLVKTPPRFRSLATSQDGRWLALGTDDSSIKLWDVAEGRTRETLRSLRGWIASVAFSPDSRLLASGGNYEDPTIRVWDVDNLASLIVLEVPTANIVSLAFSPDARLLAASTQYEGIIRIWSVETAKLLHELNSKADTVNSIAFSPDGRTLASAHYRHGEHKHISLVKLWDVARGREVTTLDANLPATVDSVAFGRDDKTVAAGYPRQGVKIWDTEKGTERVFLPGTESGMLAFSPDGSRIAIDVKPKIEIYDPQFTAPTARLSLGRPDLWAAQIAYAADGRHLVVLTGDGAVRIFRLPAE